MIEYNSNFSYLTDNLWFYSKDKATNLNAHIVNNNNFKSFYSKTKLSEDTVGQPAPNQANRITAITAVSLKYLFREDRKQ